MGRLKARIRTLAGLMKDKAALLAVSSGSPLRDAVVRATTHKESPPKDALVAFIVESSAGASASASGRLLGELMRRLSATHTWVVALKSLIVLHRLCRDGAGAVRDHITDSDATVHAYLRAALHGFADRHGGRLPLTWHVQRYARYLHTRLTLWKTGGGGGGGDEEIASEMEALAQVLADGREALAAASAAAEVAPGTRARAVVVESARLVVADWWRAQEQMRARAEHLRRRLWNMAVRPPSARLLLDAAEKAAAGEARFADALSASPLRPVLGGRGTMLLSHDLRGLLARVIDALRAVCGVRASALALGPAAAPPPRRPLLLLSHREYALPAPPPAVKRAVTLV